MAIFAPSFRLKLLLAMMLVVAGVTGTTLFVTERRVQSSYQKLFGEQFEAQVRFFTGMQESRLGFVKDRCLEIVRSVRLQEALRVAVEEGDVDLLYENAKDELRDLIQGSEARRRLTFFRLFDSRGRALVPGTAERRAIAGLKGGTTPSLSLQALASEQEVGFLAWDGEDGSRLQEVIVTRVTDRNNETLGALVLAFPVPELLDSGGGAAPAVVAGDHMLMLGLFLDGRLYTRPRVLPESVLAPLARRLEVEIGRASQPRDDFMVSAGGTPYRVFYRAPNSGSPTAYQVCLYSLADAIRDQNDLRFRILGFAGLGLVGALALSLLLSAGLSVPIRELVAGTNEIQAGNFDVKVPVRSRDEIGRLAESFNEMAVGLALKEKYRNVLNVVADEKIAEELMAGQLVLGGELRDVSVLFCDIRGFTPLTQNMPPEEVIEMLNEHMTALTHVVKEHQGVVDKFVGDLIMAIFGAPIRHGDDAVAAARCAVRMIEEREKLNRTSRHRIQMGIGLATGEAVAGCMGSADRLNYTVLGERVNLASRLCSKAGPMKVVIDSTTRERLAGGAEVVPLPPLELKGFEGQVAAYELISVAVPSNQ